MHLEERSGYGESWLRKIKRYNWFSYFSLKDEERNDLYFNVECKNRNMDEIQSRLSVLKIADRFEKDLPVLIGAEVRISGKNHIDIRLNMIDIIPEFTIAKLRSLRDITVDRLKKENLLFRQKSLAPPGLIINVGIISSEQGTSVKDIIAGLAPFEQAYNYFFIDSRMEGNSAVDSIVRALDQFNSDKTPDVDIVVIARGGGSEQSLATFNDYHLCKKICSSEIPVITAIGHEKDLSAAELCSFLTPVPATPSGVGKYLAGIFRELKENLNSNFYSVFEIVNRINDRERETLLSVSKHMSVLIVKYISSMEWKLKNLVVNFDLSTVHTLNENQLKLEKLFSGVFSKSSEYINREYYMCSETGRKIIFGIKFLFFKKRSVLVNLIGRTEYKRVFNRSAEKRREINNLIKNLVPRVVSLLDSEEKKMEILGKLIFAHDPSELLKKGYTIILDEHNSVIKRLEHFKNKKNKKIRFYDGEIFIEERRKDGR